MESPVMQLPALSTSELTGTVVQRFRAVAAALPDAIALASPERSLTFAAADRASDKIAGALHAALRTTSTSSTRGKKRHSRTDTTAAIATLLPHDVTGMLGALSALKTGRPVVPLDAHVLPVRLEQIVQAAGATLLLTDAKHRSLALSLGLPAECIVDIEAAQQALPERALLPLTAASDDLAMIVFTSGSTGAPKGVMWTHGTLLNEAYAGAERLGFTPDDRVALVLPYSFAAGLTVLVFALLNGAGAYAYDPRASSIHGLSAWLDTQRLTTLHTTPSLLRAFVATLAPGQLLSHLRLLTTCGEAVHSEDISAARSYLTAACSYVNWSGASEIGSLAFYPIPSDAPVPEGAIPAGYPAAGKDIALIREDGSPVAPGESGEVVVTSQYTASGYWRAAEASAQRFSRLPDGRTVYRMGDLGRFDADGVLTLLGRRDAAVKIRGYLVEPAEVEAALRACPGVADAVVVAAPAAAKSGQAPTQRLVAYVVPIALASSKMLSSAALRRLLAEKLPSWMVPATIVWLSELPRNERGKVDRQALPPPIAAVKPFVAPRLPWEVVMADLWMKVLQLEEISCNDDFVELGGDSLSAAELLTAISEKVGVTLPTSALIDAPTLAAFAKKIANADRSVPLHPTVCDLRVTGSRPPLFCFAGAGGLGLAFMSLARHMGPDQPVYAFQAQGLEQRGIPDWSVEAAAERHLKMLRTLAPRGPYFLAGHSLGGLIALEVAHRLRASGEEVAMLALMDTFVPGRTTVGRPPLPGITGEVPAHEPAPVVAPEKVAERIADALRAPEAAAHPGKSLRRVARDLAKELKHTVQYRLRPTPLFNMAMAVCCGVLQYPAALQYQAFWYQGRILERLHYAKPWAGRTLVYRAQDNGDPVDAWDAFLTGEHETHELPCVHHSVLREPHVAMIAAHFEREITNILAATRGTDVDERARVARVAEDDSRVGVSF